MSPLRNTAWRRAAALVQRQKHVVVLAVVIALTSSGTAAAVSYMVLGGTNTTNAITILRSDVNGTALQVTNFNSTGGTAAKGINITVPAGRPPLTVNPTAGKAINLDADKLDGLNANAFLGAGQKAADSSLLDGMDGNYFMTGPGSVIHGAVAVAPGAAAGLAEAYKFWSIIYYCPNPVTNNGSVWISNTGDDTINLFIDKGVGDPQYYQLASGSTVYPTTLATGEWLDIQIHSPSQGISEISVLSAHRPATPDCHAQLMAITSGP